MFFYLFALPVYAFLLPIYSFWHFDDFSWGNTRVVVGDTQRKIIATDEEKFDEKMIPMKKWSVYEQELWEMGSQGSRETGLTGNTYNSYAGMPPGYDNRSYYSSPSVQGGEYDFYRDSNMSEKPRHMRPSSAFTSATGSVVGSEYGGRNTPMIPMNDFNRSMMGSEYGGGRSSTMDYNRNMMGTPEFGGRSTPMMGTPEFGGRNTPMIPMSMMGTSEYGGRATSMISVPPVIPPGFPPDEEILAEIKNILATANLMSITKKQGKKQSIV
jgi:chitin synthase